MDYIIIVCFIIVLLFLLLILCFKVHLGKLSKKKYLKKYYGGEWNINDADAIEIAKKVFSREQIENISHIDNDGNEIRFNGPSAIDVLIAKSKEEDKQVELEADTANQIDIMKTAAGSDVDELAKIPSISEYIKPTKMRIKIPPEQDKIIKKYKYIEDALKLLKNKTRYNYITGFYIWSDKDKITQPLRNELITFIDLLMGGKFPIKIDKNKMSFIINLAINDSSNKIPNLLIAKAYIAAYTENGNLIPNLSIQEDNELTVNYINKLSTKEFIGIIDTNKIKDLIDRKLIYLNIKSVIIPINGDKKREGEIAKYSRGLNLLSFFIDGKYIKPIKLEKHKVLEINHFSLIFKNLFKHIDNFNLISNYNELYTNLIILSIFNLTKLKEELDILFKLISDEINTIEDILIRSAEAAKDALLASSDLLTSEIKSNFITKKNTLLVVKTKYAIILFIINKLIETNDIDPILNENIYFIKSRGTASNMLIDKVIDDSGLKILQIYVNYDYIKSTIIQTKQLSVSDIIPPNCFQLAKTEQFNIPVCISKLSNPDGYTEYSDITPDMDIYNNLYLKYNNLEFVPLITADEFKDLVIFIELYIKETEVVLKKDISELSPFIILLAKYFRTKIKIKNNIILYNKLIKNYINSKKDTEIELNILNITNIKISDIQVEREIYLTKIIEEDLTKIIEEDLNKYLKLSLADRFR